MSHKLNLDGLTTKVIGRTGWIENPKKASPQIYIPLTDITVKIGGKDYAIESIRGNPNIEIGDNIMLHFQRVGVGDNELRNESESFMKWLKAQTNLFPCDIDKLKEGKVVYQYQMPYNDTKYGKEGYCPDFD